MEPVKFPEVGKNYFVKDGNDNWVGKLVEIRAHVMVLEKATWVADSGYLSDFVKKGRAEGMEIEPVGTAMVQWRVVIDWPHKLFDKPVGRA
jgi:hypothetical protein